MNSKPHPETADRDLKELRRTLQNQRAAKEVACKRVKQTTMRAVRCCNTPTTYLDPEILKARLAEDEEESPPEE